MGSSISILVVPKGKVKRVPCFINGRLNTQDMRWKTTPKYEPYTKELVDTLEARVLLATHTQIWTFRNRSVPNEMLEKIATSNTAKETTFGSKYVDTKLEMYKRKSIEVQDKEDEIINVTEADSLEEIKWETDRIDLWFSDMKLFRRKRKHIPLTSLEEAYLHSTKRVPKWFTDMFKTGHRMFKLTPKFPKECPRASVEYDELVNASFFIIINLLKKKRLMRSCRIQASVYEQLSIHESKYGYVADPTQAQFWRQRYMYMVASADDLFTRRVQLVGKIDRSNEDLDVSKSIKKNRKNFEIIFLKGGSITSPGDVSGTYRRQMTTEKEFLTWKIDIPNVS